MGPLQNMSKRDVTAAIRAEALRLGFDLVGVTRAVESPDFEHFRHWLSLGFGGNLRFMMDRVGAYRHPGGVLDGVQSVVMLGVNYRTVEPAPATIGWGKVAASAWGADYHAIIRHRLRRLCSFHKQLLPAARTRGVVDTAPLFERQFGRLAGLGWVGKNTCLINPVFGSWFFLAALLTTEALEYDTPWIEDRCGSCRACLDACPTGARRCPPTRCSEVSELLTIESRDPMPPSLKRACGDRVFGCDTCQAVCPWNRDTPAATESAFARRAGDESVRSFRRDRAGRRRLSRPLPPHGPLASKTRGNLSNAAVAIENADLLLPPAAKGQQTG